MKIQTSSPELRIRVLPMTSPLASRCPVCREELRYFAGGEAWCEACLNDRTTLHIFTPMPYPMVSWHIKEDTAFRWRDSVFRVGLIALVIWLVWFAAALVP